VDTRYDAGKVTKRRTHNERSGAGMKQLFNAVENWNHAQPRVTNSRERERERSGSGSGIAVWRVFSTDVRPRWGRGGYIVESGWRRGEG